MNQSDELLIMQEKLKQADIILAQKKEDIKIAYLILAQQQEDIKIAYLILAQQQEGIKQHYARIKLAKLQTKLAKIQKN